MRTPAGLRVVTKAGAFGHEDALLDAARSLHGPDRTDTATSERADPDGRTHPDGADEADANKAAQTPAASRADGAPAPATAAPATSASTPPLPSRPVRTAGQPTTHPVRPAHDRNRRAAHQRLRKDVTMSEPIVAITMGDAAGVGPEVIVKALAGAATKLPFRPLVVGDAARLSQAVTLCRRGPADQPHPRGRRSHLDGRACRTAWTWASIPADLPFGKLSPVAGEGAYRTSRPPPNWPPHARWTRSAPPP